MTYTTEIDDADGICIVRVQGENRRPTDSFVLQRVARDLGDEERCQRFLFDMRKAEVVGSTIDTYTTGTVPGDKERRQVRQKIALVYSGNMANHRFMANVAVSHGYNLQVFDEISDAAEWLRSDRSARSRR